MLVDKRHIPAGKHAALERTSITLMAASKTFNAAGWNISFAIILNTTLRKALVQASSDVVPWVNVMGLEATAAAFTQCDEWYQAQLVYLRNNWDYLIKAINNIPRTQLKY